MLSHTYTKRRLLKELAYKVGIRQELSQKILDALVEIAYRESAREGFVLPGLCKFEVVDRKARKLRNPRTGETLILPPHKALKATLSGLAKRAVCPRPRAVPEAEYTPPEPPAPTPETTVAAPAPQPAPASEIQSAAVTPPVPPPPAEVAPAEPPAAPAAEETPVAPEPAAAAEAEAAAEAAPEPAAAPEPEPESAAAPEPTPEAIYFRCPQCNQEIEAPGSAAGAEAECPLCGAIVRVPEKNEDGTCGNSEVISVNEAAKMEPEALKHMTIRINAAELGLDDAAKPAEPVQMISFFCEACHQEIEASPDMAGTQTECPNCGSPITVPMFTQAPAAAATEELDSVTIQAMKNRTMRIDLNNF